LREDFLRLWIGAPGTPEGAPLEKDRSPDSRPIVNAEALDVEDDGPLPIIIADCGMRIAELKPNIFHLAQYNPRKICSESLLRPGDDGILQAFAQVHKVGTVTRDPDNEVLILLRVLLRRQ
jgi:hypothetical protein